MTTYFKNNLSYKLELAASVDNPDQRICDDVNQFVNMTLDLTFGFLRAIISTVTFSWILWKISVDIQFPIGNDQLISIPGFLTFVAFGYAIFVSWATMKVGRPLIHLDYQQERLEGDMRYSFAQHRVYSESIAFTDSYAQEIKRIHSTFKIIQKFFSNLALFQT